MDYRVDKRTQTLGDKAITVINKIPVFDSAEDRKAVLRNVESGLYNIFHKYMN